MIDDIDAPGLKALLEGSDPPLLIDVREAFELELASLPKVQHIPLGQLRERISEIDRSRPIVMVCHHGIRSRAGAAVLVHHGFTDVRNLAGGIDAWSVRVDPKVPRY